MKTLKAPITLQMIFDAAVTEFLVRRRPPCVDGSGNCRYLLDAAGHVPERRCAVGLVLPYEREDEIQNAELNAAFSVLVMFRPSWFDESVRSLPESRLDDFQYRLHDQLTRRAGLGALSGIRNENEHLEAVRLEYMAVAREYGLTLPANFPVFEEPASN